MKSWPAFLSLASIVVLMLPPAVLAASPDDPGTTVECPAACGSRQEPKPKPGATSVSLSEPGGNADSKTFDAPPLIQYGFEERVRNENWNNLTDYNTTSDDQRIQIRYRTKAWFSLNTSWADFHVKLNNEFKKQVISDVPLNMDEAIVEDLYLDLKKTFIPGLSVRVGRQDLMRGEGFILFEGNSGDGSRSQYFNAIDFTYRRKNSTFELIGILDPHQDRCFPLIHNQHKYLTDWDEQAVGFYYTDRNSKKTDVDAYYFLKKEVHDYRAATNAQFQPDRHISTVGFRISHRVRPDVTLTGEFAGQWGAQHANAAIMAPTADIRAWGGYGYVKKTFSHRMKPYVLGGYWVMSGDDDATNTIESFDPIFSRWPKWSELYIYSLVPEKGVAYWTNNRMSQAETGFSPWKPIALRATLYVMDSFHPYTRGNAAIYGSGKHRGQNLQARMDYTISPQWKGHLLYESFTPGSFYAVQSNGYFFRAEISYTFRGEYRTRSAN